MLVPAHLDTAAGARTYQRGYGLIRRRKVISRDPRIGPQIDRRTAFQRARQFWGTFTDEHYVDHYTILDLLLDPEGGLSDITGLYLAKFRLLPAGQRIFIRTVQQINGWRDLPKTISARIPAP